MISKAGITVIIVNYNSGHRLERCLDHIFSQTHAAADVIVVDNASSDESLKLAKQHQSSPRIVELSSNVGFAAANNLAVDLARSQWVAFLNPDAYADKCWLEELSLGIEKYPSVSVFGSTQVRFDDPNILDGAGDVFHGTGLIYRSGEGRPVGTVNHDQPAFSACAAAALYHRETFIDLGGFDVRFFCYGEDVDLGFRHRLWGGECMQLARAIVKHEGSAIAGAQSDFTLYHGNRNRIWLAYKNSPSILYWPLLGVRLLFDAYLLYRMSQLGFGRIFFKALRDGYLELLSFRRAKIKIMKRKRISSWLLLKMICWSIESLKERKPSDYWKQTMTPSNTPTKNA